MVTACSVRELHQVMFGERWWTAEKHMKSATQSPILVKVTVNGKGSGCF